MLAPEEYVRVVVGSPGRAVVEVAQRELWTMLTPMDWQQSVSLAIVGVTAFAFLGLRWRRRRKIGLARHAACGCTHLASRAAGPTIIFRGRKGERPEIVVKS